MIAQGMIYMVVLITQFLIFVPSSPFSYVQYIGHNFCIQIAIFLYFIEIDVFVFASIIGFHNCSYSVIVMIFSVD